MPLGDVHAIDLANGRSIRATPHAVKINLAAITLTDGLGDQTTFESAQQKANPKVGLIVSNFCVSRTRIVNYLFLAALIARCSRDF